MNDPDEKRGHHHETLLCLKAREIQIAASNLKLYVYQELRRNNAYWESDIDKSSELRVLFDIARFAGSADAMKNYACENIRRSYKHLDEAHEMLNEDLNAALLSLGALDQSSYFRELSRASLRDFSLLKQQVEELGYLLDSTGSRPPRPGRLDRRDH